MKNMRHRARAAFVALNSNRRAGPHTDLEEHGVVASRGRLRGAEVLEEAVKSPECSGHFEHERRQVLLKKSTKDQCAEEKKKGGKRERQGRATFFTPFIAFPASHTATTELCNIQAMDALTPPSSSEQKKRKRKIQIRTSKNVKIIKTLKKMKKSARLTFSRKNNRPALMSLAPTGTSGLSLSPSTTPGLSFDQFSSRNSNSD